MKIGKYLDNDEMTSKSEFGEVTRPISYSMGRTGFHRPAFYRLFCKLANLGDIDLKFSGLIFDININNNPANFLKLACSEVAVSENRLFERFLTLTLRTHNLQTR